MEPTKKPSGLVEAQIEALKKGDVDEKIKTLIEIGVLTADHKLTQKYKNWGQVVSRTETDDDEADEDNG
jgi:hypothetical protein